MILCLDKKYIFQILYMLLGMCSYSDHEYLIVIANISNTQDCLSQCICIYTYVIKAVWVSLSKQKICWSFSIAFSVFKCHWLEKKVSLMYNIEESQN